MSRLAKSKTIIRTNKEGLKKVISVLKDDLDDNSVDTIHIKNKSITKDKLSEDMTGVSIGKSGTGTNSEIFNDYENSISSGSYSHAEGFLSYAIGDYSHSEGDQTVTNGSGSHSEGILSHAIGDGSHSEGLYSIAGTKYFKVISSAVNDDDTGYYTLNSVEGISKNDVANIFTIDDEEGNISVYPVGKITEIDTTLNSVTTEEYESPSSTYYLFIPSKPTIGTEFGPMGAFSHAEGNNSKALGYASHAEGKSTANYKYSHAEGSSTANAPYTHAEGENSYALGYASHAEGVAITNELADYSHAEGYSATSGVFSHAEGEETNANGEASHAEGISTTASGYGSHSEGYSTTVSGEASHVEGYNTIASSDKQHVDGQYNIEDKDNKYVHITGNGNDENRSNAYTLDWNGNPWFQGLIKIGGNSYDDTNAKEIATKDDVASIVDTKITELGGILTKEEIINIIDERITEYILSGGDSELNTNNE